MEAVPAPDAIPEPEQARFKLFDSVASFLLRSTEQVMLLVLDDLHWADRPASALGELVRQSVRIPA